MSYICFILLKDRNNVGLGSCQSKPLSLFLCFLSKVDITLNFLGLNAEQFHFSKMIYARQGKRSASPGCLPKPCYKLCCPGPDNVIQICMNILPLWFFQQNNKYLKLPIFLFKLKLQDFQHMLSVWTALLLNWLGSYGLQPIWPRLPFARFNFHENLGFRANILDPEMLKSRSWPLMTRIID